MKKNVSLFLSIVALIVLFACNKDKKEADYNPNVLSSKDYVRAEDAMFDILNTYFKGILDTLVIEHCYGYIDNCEVCWYPDDSLLTFSYGEVNRMCQDNKFRRGQFNVVFDGNKWDQGVKANLETVDLFVEDSVVEARMVLTNNGINADNFKEISIDVDYCTIRLSDSTKLLPVTIGGNYTLQWIEGSATPAIHEDDTYLVSGTASGTSSDGYAFSVEIIDPLRNFIDCFWIEEGLSGITVPSGEYTSGTIDYLSIDGCAAEINFYFNDLKFYEVLE